MHVLREVAKIIRITNNVEAGVEPTMLGVAVWRNGNALVFINEVNLR